MVYFIEKLIYNLLKLKKGHKNVENLHYIDFIEIGILFEKIFFDRFPSHQQIRFKTRSEE